MSEISSPGAAQVLSALFLASTDCVMLLDAEGRWLDINPRGLALMEIVDFAALRGRAWVDAWPEESRAGVAEAVKRGAQGDGSHFSAFCPSALGAPRWCEIAVQPIRDAQGAAAQLLAIARDVTAARRIDQGRRVRDQQAFGAVAHDLRNVLAAMSGAARLIRRRTSDAQILDVLGHVDQAAAKGLRLTEALRDGAGAPEEP